jgi:hypothetical protein
MNFDTLFNNLYTKKHNLEGFIESVIDIPRNSLDPAVFQFPDDGFPILQPLIKTQILKDIENINRVVPIQNFYIIGSILSKHYNKNSDIDVNIEINKNVEDYDINNAHHIIKRINGGMAAGTTHPINYYIMKGKYDIEKTTAAYDVASERWIKEPEEIDITVTNYLDKFKDTIQHIDLSIASLRRNIIDFDELVTLDNKQLNQLDGLLKTKLDEIEHDVTFLIKAYQDSVEARREAFARDMTPEEIVHYGKKYKLPENVVYKMMEKYYYSLFIKKLKDILGEDGELEPENIKDIQQASKDVLSFESYLLERGKPRRKHPKEWKDPLNRHQMKAIRGLDRKNQKQVSDVHSTSLPKIYADLKHKPLIISKHIIDKAKKEEMGIWRVPKAYVKEIAQFYDVNIPNRYDKAKILGKTKIILWYKKPGYYYLVKDKAHYHMKKDAT